MAPPDSATRPRTPSLRRLLASCLGLGVAWAIWYFYFQPWLFLERVHWATRDSLSPEFGRSIRAAAALGPRARPQILHRLGRGVKETGALHSVLRKMGEPARLELVSAIDHEKDPWKRHTYVEALVYAFDDYSRLNLWIERLEADPQLVATNRMWMDLMLRFGDDVPELREGRDRISPDFLRWYDARIAPKGPFPPRRAK